MIFPHSAPKAPKKSLFSILKVVIPLHKIPIFLSLRMPGAPQEAGVADDGEKLLCVSSSEEWSEYLSDTKVSELQERCVWGCFHS